MSKGTKKSEAKHISDRIIAIFSSFLPPLSHPVVRNSGL